MTDSGIYRIVNENNGKLYIGSALSIKNRFWHHKTMLRRKEHDNIHLQRAWDKDGEGMFLFEPLIECSKDDLVSKEQWWIDFYGKKRLYNIAATAQSMLGFRHSEETKEKMRAKIISDETRERMIRAAKKRDYSHLIRNASERKGKKLSPQHIANLKGRVPWNKGQKWSAEIRAKLSMAHAGKPRPWRIGLRHSDEVKQRISAKKLGSKASPETRAKMSATHTEIWRLRRVGA